MKKCISTTISIIILGCCMVITNGCKHQDTTHCSAPNTQNSTNTVPEWTWVPWWVK